MRDRPTPRFHATRAAAGDGADDAARDGAFAVGSTPPPTRYFDDGFGQHDEDAWTGAGG